MIEVICHQKDIPPIIQDMLVPENCCFWQELYIACIVHGIFMKVWAMECVKFIGYCLKEDGRGILTIQPRDGLPRSE